MSEKLVKILVEVIKLLPENFKRNIANNIKKNKPELWKEAERRAKLKI